MDTASAPTPIQYSPEFANKLWLQVASLTGYRAVTDPREIPFGSPLGAAYSFDPEDRDQVNPNEVWALVNAIARTADDLIKNSTNLSSKINQAQALNWYPALQSDSFLTMVDRNKPLVDGEKSPEELGDDLYTLFWDIIRHARSAYQHADTAWVLARAAGEQQTHWPPIVSDPASFDWRDQQLRAVLEAKTAKDLAGELCRVIASDFKEVPCGFCLDHEDVFDWASLVTYVLLEWSEYPVNGLHIVPNLLVKPLEKENGLYGEVYLVGLLAPMVAMLAEVHAGYANRIWFNFGSPEDHAQYTIDKADERARHVFPHGNTEWMEGFLQQIPDALLETSEFCTVFPWAFHALDQVDEEDTHMSIENGLLSS